MLDAGRRELVRYDTEGNHVGATVLREALARSPLIVTSVCARGGNEVLVCEASGTPTLWRMRTDGTEAAEIALKFGEGDRIGSRPTIRSADDGTVWIGDGTWLFRVGPDGVAQRFAIRGSVSR